MKWRGDWDSKPLVTLGGFII